MTGNDRGPAIVGYDRSPASDRALRATALLTIRQVLVVVVWEPDVAFDLLAPTALIPAPVDIRAVLDVEKELYEGAQRLAEHGAALAREAGLEAEGLAVADELTVAGTLLRLARERDASVLLVGTHGHRALREVLVGTTSREVIRQAPCPVLVARAPATGARG